MTTAAQFEENEQWEEAYEAYKKDYAHNPKSIELLEKLGHLALILNKKDEAENYYLKLLEIDKSRIVAYDQLIDIYSETNKFKYYVYRGNKHVIEDQLTYAAGDFKKAIEHANNEKESMPVRFVLADIYEKIEKDNNAIDEYLRLTDMEDVNEIAFIKLAKLYQKTDYLTGAIETLELCIKKLPEDKRPETNEYLADLYIRNSQPDLALNLTKNELTKIRCLIDMSNLEEAFNLLEEVKDKYLKEPKYYSLSAQYYFQKRDYERALSEVEKFAEFDSNSPLIYQMRALIYEATGDKYKEHVNWAKYHFLRGDKDIALNEYMIAYSIIDSDASLIDTIADFLYVSDDQTQAAEFYEKLLHIEPENRKALERLAEFREKIGDTYEMIRYLERLKKVDPRNEMVDKKLEEAYSKQAMGGNPLDFVKKLFTFMKIG
ncbi:hypothetical protein IJI31_00950 [bacterium]|nr:hypothetical protein [bacterium]